MGRWRRWGVGLRQQSSPPAFGYSTTGFTGRAVNAGGFALLSFSLLRRKGGGVHSTNLKHLPISVMPILDVELLS